MGAREVEHACRMGGAWPYVRRMGTTGTRISRGISNPFYISTILGVQLAYHSLLTSVSTTASERPWTSEMGNLGQRPGAYIHKGPRGVDRRCCSRNHTLARTRRRPSARRRPRSQTPSHWSIHLPQQHANPKHVLRLRSNTPAEDPACSQNQSGGGNAFCYADCWYWGGFEEDVGWAGQEDALGLAQGFEGAESCGGRAVLGKFVGVRTSANRRLSPYIR